MCFKTNFSNCDERHKAQISRLELHFFPRSVLRFFFQSWKQYKFLLFFFAFFNGINHTYILILIKINTKACRTQASSYVFFSSVKCMFKSQEFKCSFSTLTNRMSSLIQFSYFHLFCLPCE